MNYRGYEIRREAGMWRVLSPAKVRVALLRTKARAQREVDQRLILLQQDETRCRCGHLYDSHDTHYEDVWPCKLCACEDFTDAPPKPELRLVKP